MDALFQHAQFEEDQGAAHEILTLHVLSRGHGAGALLAALTALASRLTRYRLPLYKSATIGSAIGVGLMTMALRGRMRDKSEIEWQERSWRILANRSQVMTDWAMLGGATAGALYAATRKVAIERQLWRLFGGAGLGSAVGLVLGMTTVRP